LLAIALRDGDPENLVAEMDELESSLGVALWDVESDSDAAIDDGLDLMDGRMESDGLTLGHNLKVGSGGPLRKLKPVINLGFNQTTFIVNL